MKTHQEKKTLLFGDFITAVYDAWGKRLAKDIISFAIKARLIEFRGQQRLVIP